MSQSGDRMEGLLLQMDMETLLEGDPDGIFTFAQLIKIGYSEDVVHGFQRRLENKTERTLFATEVDGVWLTTEERLKEAIAKLSEE